MHLCCVVVAPGIECVGWTGSGVGDQEAVDTTYVGLLIMLRHITRTAIMNLILIMLMMMSIFIIKSVPLLLPEAE